MNDLEQRITELERRTTRYRNMLVALVVGICAVAVVGATTDDGIIRGRILMIENQKGKPVVVVKADDAVGEGPGNGGVYISNSEGKLAVILLVDGYGNGDLRVFSKSMTPLVQAGALDDGHGALKVYSNDGDLRTGIAGNEDGFQISGFNKTGDEVVHAYTDEYGNGVVGAYNRKGMGKTLEPGP
jgi:hypothetical protein